MFKSVLSSIAKSSSKRIQKSPVSRKLWLQETTLADHKSSQFNPRRARSKSVKGLSILNREL